MYGYEFQQPRMAFALPRITWAAQRLILLNASIFALQLAMRPIEAWWLVSQGTDAPLSPVIRCFGFHPGLFFSGYLWTAFTYQFLHGDLLHLFMNMLWLFVFGPDVERTLGSRQFMGFYLACGMLGVLATLGPYLLTGVYAPVIGASGAAMGVLVAFAMIDPQRQLFLFPLPFRLTATWLVILVVLMNLATLRLGTANVSVATHFGGMAVGAALMKAIPLYHRRRRRRGGPLRPGRDGAQDTEDKIRDAIDNIFRFKGDL